MRRGQRSTVEAHFPEARGELRHRGREHGLLRHVHEEGRHQRGRRPLLLERLNAYKAEVKSKKAKPAHRGDTGVRGLQL